MNKSSCILALIAFLLFGLAPSAYSQVISRRFRHFEPVKLSTTLLPAQDSSLIALRFVFRVGSQDDPPGKEGLAALTAAMITEGGTSVLTYEQLLERFYPMASGLAGASYKELTVFSGLVHQDNLKRYVPLVASMITSPRFNAEDFDRLKNEALDYLSKSLRAGDDEELAKSTLQLDLYKNHPYGHLDRGSVESLKSISIDDVKAFHHHYFTREALTVGLAGGAQSAILESLGGYLADLPSRSAMPIDLPAPRIPRGLEVTIVEKPAASTAISLGFPINITRRDDDF